jgi:hypothetical protein
LSFFHPCQVINWAFSLLINAADGAPPPATASRSSSSSGPVLTTSTSNGQALVALTGLLRVLWHHLHVVGIPADLRDLLLVAMALRNLLLVVALPLWARKAVAAQLNAWQRAIGQAQATDPLVVTSEVRVVHLLRVLEEVRWAWGGGLGCAECVSVQPAMYTTHHATLDPAAPAAATSSHHQQPI